MQLPSSSGYKTQSIDTSIEAELVLFGLWRQKSTAEKGQLLRKANFKVRHYAILGIQNQLPEADPCQVRWHYISRRLGQTWANLFRLEGQRQLLIEESLWLAERIAEIFNQLNIPYYIGGSVASSLLGEVRATEDLDLIAKIERSQIHGLIQAMSPDFYISDVAIDDALSGRTSSFNIIHLTTTEKADIFLLREDDFSRSQMSRRRPYVIANGNLELYICSTEDVILQKLLWHRMTERRSQKQWRDILGVLKLQGQRLDFDYLQAWGSRLNLLAELNQALIESGLNPFAS